MATTRLFAPIRRRLSACVLAVFASQGALAQAPPDLDPAQFQVAEQEGAAATALGIKASIGLDAWDRRRAVDGVADAGLRSVLDLRREWHLGSGWSATFSGRLEGTGDGHTSTVHKALREAYVAKRMGDSLFVDVGRINLRSGVASGFNPTDWLREAAALPQTTQNPVSLRENRLGTVMLRLQAIENWGAVQLAVVPHLAHQEDGASPDGLAWERTNDDKALHVRVAPQLNDALSLDLLAYARENRHPQWGLNLTSVLHSALIAHAELATGLREGLAAPGVVPSTHMHQRVAAGFNWTTPQGAVLTVERHSATDALNPQDWEAWRLATDRPTLRGLAQLRTQRSDLQEPLVRDAWFFRAAVTGLSERANVDLGAFVRLNAHDHSALWQVDGAWHVRPRVSVYASLGGFAGTSLSEFGANPTRTLMSVRLETVF